LEERDQDDHLGIRNKERKGALNIKKKKKKKKKHKKKKKEYELDCLTLTKKGWGGR